MKKILLSILTIGLVSSVAFGATQAYFSHQEEVLGNQIAMGTLSFDMQDYMAWEFPFENMAPGMETGRQRQLITWTGTLKPDHLEFDVDVHDFVDPANDSSLDEFMKQIEVLEYVINGPRESDPAQWHWQNLAKKNEVDAYDGKPDFISLYDIVKRGIVDNIVYDYNGEFQLRLNLGLPADLPDDDDNKYQGDSLMIDFEVGAAQVAGQNVLTD